MFKYNIEPMEKFCNCDLMNLKCFLKEFNSYLNFEIRNYIQCIYYEEK